MCVHARVSVLICACVCMQVCVHKNILSSGDQNHTLRMISKHSTVKSSQLHEHLNRKGGDMVEHDHNLRPHPTQTSVVSLLITGWMHDHLDKNTLFLRFPPSYD